MRYRDGTRSPPPFARIRRSGRGTSAACRRWRRRVGPSDRRCRPHPGVPFAAFAVSENTSPFLPVFRNALIRRGPPQRLYVDNGASARNPRTAHPQGPRRGTRAAIAAPDPRTRRNPAQNRRRCPANGLSGRDASGTTPKAATAPSQASPNRPRPSPTAAAVRTPSGSPFPPLTTRGSRRNRPREPAPNRPPGARHDNASSDRPMPDCARLVSDRRRRAGSPRNER